MAQKRARRRKPSCAATSVVSSQPSGGSMAHPASTLNCAEKGAAMRDAGLSGSCATWVCRPRAASDVGPKPNGPMRDELTTALASLCAPELSRFRGWLWCGSCIIPSVSAFEE